MAYNNQQQYNQQAADPDEQIDRKKEQVTADIQKIKQQFANVQAIFYYNEMSMLQTQEIGEAMFGLYSDGSLYKPLFERVRKDMVGQSRILEKNRKILANLNGNMEQINYDYTMFTSLSKKRDQDKKKYVHYRDKLAKLREKEAKQQQKNVTSGSMAFGGKSKDRERLLRNVGKFEQAEHFFKSANKALDENMGLISKKLDQMAINLNIKFVSNITINHYRNFDDIFGKMKNITNEINEIRHQIEHQVVPAQEAPQSNSGDHYGYDQSHYQGQGYSQSAQY